MTEIVIRPASHEDLPAIVAMLADDPLGAKREDPAQPLQPRYLQAFAAIAASPDHQLVVMEWEGEVLATLQLSFIPGISRRGAWRGVIEGVRVRADRRGMGLGARLIAWAAEQCRDRGCGVIELAAHESRTEAHRFYKRLGFKPTHVGFKLEL
jgi:GNAT superfamily N-acetyltransferase